MSRGEAENAQYFGVIYGKKKLIKMTVRVLIICLLSVCFGNSLCAQVSPKARILKKPASSARHKASRSKQYFQIALLQGVWSDSSENNAVFWIKGKRVFFFDHIGDTENEKENLTYWSVFNNKLSFHYSGGLVVTDNIIKLNRDSLILYRRDNRAGVVGYSRYVRLK